MADLHEDNLIVKDGSYFARIMAQPEAKKEALDEQKAVERLEPILKDSITYLQEQVDFYGSLNAIDDSLLTNPDEFMHAVAANKIVRTVLSRELKRLEDLYTEYVR